MHPECLFVCATALEHDQFALSPHQARQLWRRQPHELSQEGIARRVAARQLYRAAGQQQALTQRAVRRPRVGVGQVCGREVQDAAGHRLCARASVKKCSRQGKADCICLRDAPAPIWGRAQARQAPPWRSPSLLQAFSRASFISLGSCRDMARKDSAVWHNLAKRTLQ